MALLPLSEPAYRTRRARAVWPGRWVACRYAMQRAEGAKDSREARVVGDALFEDGCVSAHGDVEDGDRDR
jgi:hypothetical protein